MTSEMVTSESQPQLFLGVMLLDQGIDPIQPFRNDTEFQRTILLQHLRGLFSIVNSVLDAAHCQRGQ